MRSVAIGVVTLVLALAGATVAAAHPAPSTTTGTAPSATTASTVGANADASLALAMLARLHPGANTVVSPLSVLEALAMVDLGARGQTAAQLSRLLGANTPTQAAAVARTLGHDAAQAVRGHGRGGPTLADANGLWVQSGQALANVFSANLELDFGASAQQIDFTDPAAAVAAVDGWVSAHTQGLIPSLLGPRQITAATRLVLANAIYLNARWQAPFDARRTAPASFDTPSGATRVPFMSTGSESTTPDPYVATPRYRAVALPYAHSSLQFLAVMPPAGDIGALSRWLDAARLDALAASLRPRTLDLSMPKFTLSTQTSLNAFLQSQGAGLAFGPRAQIDRILADHRPLAITAVEHAAVLKVAERGTVAAAATGVSMAPTAVAAAPLSLVLDHPFLVFIRDADSGAILFAARVLDPSRS